MTYSYTEVINSVYFNKQIKGRILKLVPYNLHGDMMNHIVILLYDMDDDKLAGLYSRDELVPYVMTMVYRQMNVKCKNCFYKMYIGDHIQFEDQIFFQTEEYNYDKDIEHNKRLCMIYKELRHMKPWKVRAWEYYHVAGLNYRQTSEAMRINHNTIQRWVNDVMKELKNKLN